MSFYTAAMQAPPDVHVEWVDEEAVVLNTATNEIHYLSPSAAYAYAMILEYGYTDALQRIAAEQPGADIVSDVELLVSDLVARGLLVDG